MGGGGGYWGVGEGRGGLDSVTVKKENYSFMKK